MKNFKSLLSIILAVVMVASMIVLPVAAEDAEVWDEWDGTATDDGWKTKGSDGKYHIANAEQLANFAAEINSGSTSTAKRAYKDETVVLDVNIRLNDVSDFASWGTTAPANSWTPIGGYPSQYQVFSGTFDGQGHTIEGMYCVTGSRQALFGAIDECTVIQNLNVTNAYVSGSGNGCGIIAGQMANPDNNTVDAKIFQNITVSNSYLKSASSGGTGVMLGRSAGLSGQTITFYNCNVLNTTIDAVAYVSAMFGWHGSTSLGAVVFDTCTISDVTIKSTGAAAGLLSGCHQGGSDSAKITAKNCIVDATIESTGAQVGGLIGGDVKCASITVTDTIVTGKISGTNAVAGLVADFRGEKLNATNVVVAATLNGSEYVGGYVGDTNTNASTYAKCYFTFEACVFNGAVTASSRNAGGFIGDYDTSSGTAVAGATNNCGVFTFKNCSVDADITASGSSGNAGGLVGRIYPPNGKLVIENVILKGARTGVNAAVLVGTYGAGSANALTNLVNVENLYFDNGSVANLFGTQKTTDGLDIFAADNVIFAADKLAEFEAVLDASEAWGKGTDGKYYPVGLNYPGHEHAWGEWEDGVHYCTIFGCTASEDKTLATIAPVVDVWDGTADTSWYTASGTSYTFTTAEQLAGLAQLVADGKTFSGVSFALDSDLQLNSDSDVANFANWATSAPANKWFPIGNYAGAWKNFLGSFNGNGHTITGLYVDGASDGHYYAGLFGAMAGAINNLNIDKAYVISGSNAAGILSGSQRDANGTDKTAAISGISITNAYLKMTNAAGGALLIGRGGSCTTISISDCYVQGTVAGGKDFVAAALGYSSGTVTNVKFNNVYVDATVSGGVGTAGLMGKNEAISGSVEVKDCVVKGTISGTRGVGGVWGETRQNHSIPVTVTNTIVDADIEGYYSVGGILGHSLHANAKLTVKDTAVLGSIATTSTDLNDSNRVSGADVGALVGAFGFNGGSATENVALDNFYYDATFSTAVTSDAIGENDTTNGRLGSFYSKAGGSFDDSLKDGYTFYTPMTDVTSNVNGLTFTVAANTVAATGNGADFFEKLVAGGNFAEGSDGNVYPVGLNYPGHEHAWSDWVEYPDAELKVRVCTITGCAAADSEELEIEETVVCTCRGGGDWSPWRVEVDSTCTKDGTIYRVCKKCDAKETSVLPAAHTWGAWSKHTCADGATATSTRRCTKCGTPETKTVTTTHASAAWVTVTEATATATGLENLVCLDCNTVLDTKITAKLQGGTPVTPVEPTTTYTDIAGHKYEADIKAVTDAGLFNGMGDNKFAPEATMTRAMIVTVLARLENVDVTVYTNTFTDVAADSYYAPYVGWAEAAKITNGVGDGKFAPEDEITREQAIAMIVRYLEFKNNRDTTSNNTAGFTDMGTVSAWAAEAVNELIRLGVVDSSEATLRPTADATRAELANLFANLLEYLG